MVILCGFVCLFIGMMIDRMLFLYEVLIFLRLMFLLSVNWWRNELVLCLCVS